MIEVQECAALAVKKRVIPTALPSKTLHPVFLTEVFIRIQRSVLEDIQITLK